MTHRLDGIRFKRERAWGQLNGLKAEMRAFIDSDPYQPRLKHYPESEQLAIWVEAVREPDPVWNIKIGEIVYNLRCCLDYLTCELFLIKNCKEVPRRLQFPIFMQKSRFINEGIWNHLPGIDKTHVEMIRSEQPFSIADGGTGEGRKSPLWHLYKLSNTDKHRTLQLTGYMVREYHFAFPEVTIPFTKFTLECLKSGPIQKDATLWRGKLIGATEWPFSEDDVQGALAIDIVFDRNVPVVGGWLTHQTLADIANRTDRILKLFFEGVWGAEL